MGKAIDWIARLLVVAGVTAVAIVGFVAFLVFARPFFALAAIGALLVCPVLCFLSPRFRAWLAAGSDWLVSYHGLRLATDIAIHPSHSWARITPNDVAVGADDLVQATLGPVESVELPPVGARVEQGDRLFSLRRGNRSVEVRAPVSGTVVTRNEALLEYPNLVNENPFSDGWAVRLRADNIRDDARRLLRGNHARGWFRHEIDRLMGTVHAGEPSMTVLADGGTVVSDLYRQIDDVAWKKLQETFFATSPGR